MVSLTTERSTWGGSGFLGGSLPSVLPFLFVDSTNLGLTIAAVFTAAGLFAVGAVKTVVTKTNPVKSGLENLVIAGIGGIIAFYIGALVDGAIG